MRTTVLEFRKLANWGKWTKSQQERGRTILEAQAAFQLFPGLQLPTVMPTGVLHFQMLPREPALLRTVFGPASISGFVSLFLWVLQSPSA